MKVFYDFNRKKAITEKQLREEAEKAGEYPSFIEGLIKDMIEAGYLVEIKERNIKK